MIREWGKLKKKEEGPFPGKKVFEAFLQGQGGDI